MIRTLLLMCCFILTHAFANEVTLMCNGDKFSTSKEAVELSGTLSNMLEDTEHEDPDNPVLPMPEWSHDTLPIVLLGLEYISESTNNEDCNSIDPLQDLFYKNWNFLMPEGEEERLSSFIETINFLDIGYQSEFFKRSLLNFICGRIEGESLDRSTRLCKVVEQSIGFLSVFTDNGAVFNVVQRPMPYLRKVFSGEPNGASRLDRLGDFMRLDDTLLDQEGKPVLEAPKIDRTNGYIITGQPTGYIDGADEITKKPDEVIYEQQVYKKDCTPLMDNGQEVFGYKILPFCDGIAVGGSVNGDIPTDTHQILRWKFYDGDGNLIIQEDGEPLSLEASSVTFVGDKIIAIRIDDSIYTVYDSSGKPIQEYKDMIMEFEPVGNCIALKGIDGYVFHDNNGDLIVDIDNTPLTADQFKVDSSNIFIGKGKHWKVLTLDGELLEEKEFRADSVSIYLDGSLSISRKKFTTIDAYLESQDCFSSRIEGNCMVFEYGTNGLRPRSQKNYEVLKNARGEVILDSRDYKDLDVNIISAGNYIVVETSRTVQTLLDNACDVMLEAPVIRITENLFFDLDGNPILDNDGKPVTLNGSIICGIGEILVCYAEDKSRTLIKITGEEILDRDGNPISGTNIFIRGDMIFVCNDEQVYVYDSNGMPVLDNVGLNQVTLKSNGSLHDISKIGNCILLLPSCRPEGQKLYNVDFEEISLHAGFNGLFSRAHCLDNKYLVIPGCSPKKAQQFLYTLNGEPIMCNDSIVFGDEIKMVGDKVAVFKRFSSIVAMKYPVKNKSGSGAWYVYQPLETSQFVLRPVGRL